MKRKRGIPDCIHKKDYNISHYRVLHCMQNTFLLATLKYEGFLKIDHKLLSKRTLTVGLEQLRIFKICFIALKTVY